MVILNNNENNKNEMPGGTFSNMTEVKGCREVIVGVPTYNNEDTIGPTIEMLLGQTRSPDRIVFCDKSDDQTRERIRDFQQEDQDVSIEILDQEGSGVADAYNEILKYVSGEYDLFATIQTDLTIDENWLGGHLEIHEKHPEIDMVTGAGGDRKMSSYEATPDNSAYYTGRNFSVKAGVLERVDGWDTNFLRGEDWDMRIRLAGAGTRVFASEELLHDWQQSEPSISLSKAKRKPTSVTFLSKYGNWYTKFHPSHVLSDIMSVTAIVGAGGTVGLLPIVPTMAAASAFLLSLSVVIYWIGHISTRGGVDGDRLLGPTRKQLLNGIAVFYAFNRVVLNDVEWNLTGFNPENIPRYKF